MAALTESASLRLACLLAASWAAPALQAQAPPDETALARLLEEADMTLARTGPGTWSRTAVGAFQDEIPILVRVQGDALVVQSVIEDDGLGPRDLALTLGTARLQEAGGGSVVATARERLGQLGASAVFQMIMDVSNLVERVHAASRGPFLSDPDCALAVWFDESVWSRAELPLLRSLNHRSGRASVVVELDGPGLATTGVRDAALGEARALDPHLRVRREGTQTVGDLALAVTEYESQGLVYVGYFYGGAEGTLALKGLAAEPDVAAHRPDLEKLVEGIRPRKRPQE